MPKEMGEYLEQLMAKREVRVPGGGYCEWLRYLLGDTEYQISIEKDHYLFKAPYTAKDFEC